MWKDNISMSMTWNSILQVTWSDNDYNLTCFVKQNFVYRVGGNKKKFMNNKYDQLIYFIKLQLLFKSDYNITFQVI